MQICLLKGQLMLIIKAFVNNKEIDSVQIQNMNRKHGHHDMYKIIKPEIKYPIILHKRALGWKTLASIAFTRIIASKRKSK